MKLIAPALFAPLSLAILALAACATAPVPTPDPSAHSTPAEDLANHVGAERGPSLEGLRLGFVVRELSQRRLERGVRGEALTVTHRTRGDANGDVP